MYEVFVNWKFLTYAGFLSLVISLCFLSGIINNSSNNFELKAEVIKC